MMKEKFCSISKKCGRMRPSTTMCPKVFWVDKNRPKAKSEVTFDICTADAAGKTVRFCYECSAPCTLESAFAGSLLMRRSTASFLDALGYLKVVFEVWSDKGGDNE